MIKYIRISSLIHIDTEALNRKNWLWTINDIHGFDESQGPVRLRSTDEVSPAERRGSTGRASNASGAGLASLVLLLAWGRNIASYRWGLGTPMAMWNSGHSCDLSGRYLVVNLQVKQVMCFLGRLDSPKNLFTWFYWSVQMLRRFLRGVRTVSFLGWTAKDPVVLGHTGIWIDMLELSACDHMMWMPAKPIMLQSWIVQCKNIRTLSNGFTSLQPCLPNQEKDTLLLPWLLWCY